VDDQAKLAEGILDQAADAVIFADRSGKIARWNRASALLFGFRAEEALGQSLDLIVPGHLRAAHWRGRCHGVGGLVAEEHDENQLFRISVPSGDHSPGDLALSPVHA
jgi:PAS domain S-box-containing protein